MTDVTGRGREVSAHNMQDWSRKGTRQEPESVMGSSSNEKSSISDPAVPVWVTHTPTPDNMTDDGEEDDVDSTRCTSSTASYAEKAKDDKNWRVKDRLTSLFPLSWGRVMFTKKRDDAAVSEASSSRIQILPNGTRVSPPVSPMLERRNWDESVDDTKPSFRETHTGDLLSHIPHEESLLSSIHPAEYYAEKMEVYKQKYSYLKSWPGLLRLLAGLELLFGGMVFACVIAYIQKDSEWSNTFGLYNGAYNNGLGLSGYSYTGPMTPFVLSVTGISWIMTFILLVMGMTMYYRTILLDAPWWPLTEAFMNIALFLLYMSAAIVYLNDLNRGGLCYMTIGVNPIVANLCRVDGGQMAGSAFIFINMTMYLGSFLVCLKMWRHEATRRERQNFVNKPRGESHRSIPAARQKAQHISFQDETDRSVSKDAVNRSPEAPVSLKRTLVPVRVVADYILKYPEISCVEEREKYKAVFNDQYQEYKDLYKDISSLLDKFSELDDIMARLVRDGRGQDDRQRIQLLMKKYQQKKNDNAFLEKKERCDYLKAKLSHIKHRIRTFDEEMSTQMK